MGADFLNPINEYILWDKSEVGTTRNDLRTFTCLTVLDVLNLLDSGMVCRASEGRIRVLSHAQPETSNLEPQKTRDCVRVRGLSTIQIHNRISHNVLVKWF